MISGCTHLLPSVARKYTSSGASIQLITCLRPDPVLVIWAIFGFPFICSEMAQIFRIWCKIFELAKYNLRDVVVMVVQQLLQLKSLQRIVLVLADARALGPYLVVWLEDQRQLCLKTDGKNWVSFTKKKYQKFNLLGSATPFTSSPCFRFSVGDAALVIASTSHLFGMRSYIKLPSAAFGGFGNATFSGSGILSFGVNFNHSFSPGSGFPKRFAILVTLPRFFFLYTNNLWISVIVLPMIALASKMERKKPTISGNSAKKKAERNRANEN